MCGQVLWHNRKLICHLEKHVSPYKLLPGTLCFANGENEAQKGEHSKKVYGKRQSDKEPRYSGPVLALRGRLSQSKTKLWDTMNTFMNDNHFKYGGSQSSAQPVEGGESMQGWTSFIQNMKPSCFSDQGDGGRTGLGKTTI